MYQEKWLSFVSQAVSVKELICIIHDYARPNFHNSSMKTSKPTLQITTDKENGELYFLTEDGTELWKKDVFGEDELYQRFDEKVGCQGSSNSFACVDRFFVCLGTDLTFRFYWVFDVEKKTSYRVNIHEGVCDVLFLKTVEEQLCFLTCNQRLNQLQLVDLDTRKSLKSWSSYKENELFESPRALAQDFQYLYVVNDDFSKKQVLMFDLLVFKEKNELQFVKQWEYEAQSQHFGEQWIYVEIDPVFNLLFLSFWDDSKIYVFDSLSGCLKKVLDNSKRIVDMTYDPNWSELLVADARTGTIQSFSFLQ